jgi:hypothetical protein
VPLQIEESVLHAIHYTEIFEHPLVPAFLLNGLLGMVVGSIVGLVEVVMAYELIARQVGHAHHASDRGSVTRGNTTELSDRHV